MPQANVWREELSALAAKLRQEIPVSQHLGIRPSEWDGRSLVLTAPLAANVNHEGTAFAGSVHALATLTGWSAVWLSLRQARLPSRVVIQDSRMAYQHPISEDFRARCTLPAPGMEGLLNAVRRHGRGRIALEVEVQGAEQVLARFSGRYVAFAGER